MEKIEELVYQSVGAASMCWIGGPSGEFDQKNAARIAKELMDAIKEHEAAAVLKAQSAWHLSHTTIIRDANGQEIARSK